MGYVYTKDEPAIVKFREDIKKRIEYKMTERGYGRDAKNEHRKHLSTAAYELEKRADIAEQRYVEAEKQISEIMRREQEANKLLETARQIRKVLEELVHKVKDELFRQQLKSDLSHIEIPGSDTGHSIPGKRTKATTIDGKPVSTVDDFIDKYTSESDSRLDTNLTYVAQIIQEPGAAKKLKQKDKSLSR